MYYSINKDNNIDNPTIRQIFKSYTKINLYINNNIMNIIRNNILPKYKNISFGELINKINIDGIELESYILDAVYEYKGNNNKIYERKERLIFLG